MMLDNIGLVGEHLQEQIAYRMLQCKDCLIQESCKYCGCAVPGKLYVTESCNNGERFPDLMNSEDWDKFKEDNQIE